MNDKFFELPLEKQEKIINAGFRVFSQNSYKKSPMSEIADAAGISKSLLFYYFHNKKELYLFLWDKCATITIETLMKSGCYFQTDFFDSMYKGMKAYYEKDPEVFSEIQASIAKHGAFKANAKLLNLDPEQFIPGLDIEMMYQDMYWASEGYLWDKVQGDNIDVDAMEQEFTKLIDFWKSIYLRKGESYGSN